MPWGQCVEGDISFDGYGASISPKEHLRLAAGAGERGADIVEYARLWRAVCDTARTLHCNSVVNQDVAC